MKKHLLFRTLLVAAVLLLGGTSAWASSTTASAGSDDNSTPWNHQDGGKYLDDWVTQDYKLTGNGTYTFNLTTTNAATADHDNYGWSLFLGKKGWLNIWDTWLVGTSSTGNVWGNGTGTKSATNNYRTKNPTGAGIYSAMNNSTVVVTVTRTSSYIKAVVKVTPKTENAFTIVWSYYYADSKDATADLYINFAVEYAYVNITSANFESASSAFPTPVYFKDFSEEGLDIVGDGKFVSDETPGFGQVFENAASNTPRTNYLLLSGAFSDFTYENANTEMTIGFWVNAKNAGDASNYTYAPLFGAYGSAPNPNNGTPMLCLQSRGLAQLNNNGWCDFTYVQNVAPNAGKNTVYNDYAWDATTSTWGETNGNHVSGGNWLADKEWHYYTLTLTPRNVIIYLDGEVKNKWVLDGDSKGRNIIGSIVNGSALSYVALGGNQAWGNADNDAAFMFDDFAVYDKALTAEQIAQIIADKTPTYSYTVNAVDGNGNILKQLTTGTDKSGASIAQKVPQFVLVGTTLYETAQVAANEYAYSTVFDLSEDNKVVNVLYTSVAENVVFFAEGEDVISGLAVDSRKDASLGLLGGRQKISATDYVNWTTLPAGKWNVCVRTFTGNSGEHALNIKMDSDSEPQATETYTSADAWQIADKKITAANAGTLQIGFAGGGSTGIDWVYIQGTPDNEVVGATDCSTPYATTWNTTPLWINAGETAKYTFVNHNSGMGAGWNNWNLWAANAESVNKTVIRADAYAVVPEAYDGWKSVPTYPTDIVTDLNGATVEITVSLADAGNGTYTLNATATSKAYEGSLVYEQTGITDSKMKVYLSVDKSWLEILSEKVVMEPINDYGWVTFASDNALNFEGIEGLTAYAVTGTNGAAIEKEELAEVPAATPLLINGEANQTYIVPVIANAADLAVNNLMVRGTGAAIVKNDVNPRYVLSLNSKNEIAFKLIGATSPVVAVNKAYLQLAAEEATLAPQFINIIGGTTGIDALDSETEAQVAEGAIYNLAGQRVSKDYKGLVIMNGKKVIKK